MIGASLLAPGNSIVARNRYLEIAERAVTFTVDHQTADGAWYYGVSAKWKWIDSFHTGYVLEAFDIFRRYTSTEKYVAVLGKRLSLLHPDFLRSRWHTALLQPQGVSH
jgi:hypothetical protein